MKRYGCVALTVAGALVVAASAAAQSVVPTPTTYTAGAAVPSSALGPIGEYVYGSHWAKTVQPGTTVLVYDLTLVEGQTTDLTMGCPAGTVVADINISGPSTGFGETTQLPDFTPWYGQNAPSVSFGTHVPGALTWTVMCLPTATSTTTVVRGRSPVAFPSSQIVPGVGRGAKLPKGATVLKSATTSALNAGGTWVTTTRRCPTGTYQSQSVVTSPGAGGTGGVDNAVIVYPSSALGSGAVTVYALCAPPPKPVATVKERR